MVKVRDDHPVKEDGTVDIPLWISMIEGQVSLANPQKLERACELAQEVYIANKGADDDWSAYGNGCFLIGLEMAQILSELQQDEDSLIAAVLYRCVREKKLSVAQVHKRFGAKISTRIEGVLQMAAIGSRINPRTGDAVLGSDAPQVDTVRKMLVAMIDDVRVALIKIAERTCAIRSVKNADRMKRYLVAREVFDIYAPLAHRLGIGHIKWELEDLSFRYLKPNDYKTIAKMLDGKRIERQKFIDTAVDTVCQKLQAQNIEADVQGRAKHIYSIWRKMQRKNIEFSQVYDMRAVRVLVPDVRDCYAALGIVHGIWRNIPHEFDDYIASPKPNGYRSLHTAVFGPEGKVLEIQIRTAEMHEEAELGVCAHHVYKGTDTDAGSDSYEDKITWLRQVLEWHEDLGEAEGLGEILRTDVVQDRLYLFTPDGHVIDMQNGATAIDFAYRVHTEIGHRCCGAKVNGRIVPLNKPLTTGDQVEILTGSEQKPRRDWLNLNLGYVTTSKARAKVAHWFKLQDKDKNIAAGRQIIEREFNRLAINAGDIDLKVTARQINFQQINDMYAALGAGDIRLSQILNATQSQLGDRAEDEQLPLALSATRKAQDKASDNSGISILGVANLLTNIASCCQPVPGDLISGFITQGRGVSIHRDDCSNLMTLRENDAVRIVPVEWGEKGERTYPVEIAITAYDRSGLLRDMMTVFANEHCNVLSANTKTDRQNSTANFMFTIEVARLDSLGRLMDKVNQVSNVIDVRRNRSNPSQ
ncbi:MAG: GTP diphosphokinase [Pseudomonadales bacterium]|nr:GTP diphosphokinase [Pseudomonadales bacterium]NRA16296.1 GTP diphosphokinase [Oceanospirillaceae bacterium]